MLLGAIQDECNANLQQALWSGVDLCTSIELTSAPASIRIATHWMWPFLFGDETFLHECQRLPVGRL